MSPMFSTDGHSKHYAKQTRLAAVMYLWRTITQLDRHLHNCGVKGLLKVPITGIEISILLRCYAHVEHIISQSYFTSYRSEKLFKYSSCMCLYPLSSAHGLIQGTTRLIKAYTVQYGLIDEGMRGAMTSSDGNITFATLEHHKFNRSWQGAWLHLMKRFCKLTKVRWYCITIICRTLYMVLIYSVYQWCDKILDTATGSAVADVQYLSILYHPYGCRASCCKLNCKTTSWRRGP